MAALKLFFADMKNPLFLHPSDNASSIQVEKLQGVADYRSWRRSMEINLSSKQKMGFVTRATKQDHSDKIWEEIDSMNTLPILTSLTTEMTKFIGAINKYKEESRDSMLCDSTRRITEGSLKTSKLDLEMSACMAGIRWIGCMKHVELLPTLTSPPVKESETDKEIDSHFSGMITCHMAEGQRKKWIIDSGASNHMTPYLESFCDTTAINSTQQINLFTRAKASISHVEKAKLGNGLVPKKHMCVSTFQHNLLSVQRLIADNKCEVKFYPDHYFITYTVTKVVKGTSKEKDGLYYLNNDVSEFLSSCMNSSHDTGHEFNLWHNRLGHASLSKLKYIDCVKPFLNSKPKNVCLTYPMSKFTKLSFSISKSHVIDAFELVHMDIWGPYRVCNREKFRYFLTLVDDHTRSTWVYLLQYKS
ncbi:Retrovirus-related Pol polyprotein from transposon RE2 [Bienertia sinuspersici]